MFGKKFAFGVNYWASENATRMWRDFNAEAVENIYCLLVAYKAEKSYRNKN